MAQALRTTEPVSLGYSMVGATSCVTLGDHQSSLICSFLNLRSGDDIRGCFTEPRKARVTEHAQWHLQGQPVCEEALVITGQCVARGCELTKTFCVLHLLSVGQSLSLSFLNCDVGQQQHLPTGVLRTNPQNGIGETLDVVSINGDRLKRLLERCCFHRQIPSCLLLARSSFLLS